MMSQTPDVEDLVALFRAALKAGNGLSHVLDRFLSATDSQAVGLWKCERNQLVQLGFRAVDNMDAQVCDDFAKATRCVPLENTGLGIVKAVLDDAPFLATVAVATGQSGLNTSASWLERFQAKNSLAHPIRRDSKVTGVLAISSSHDLSRDAAPGVKLLRDIAGQIEL